jgi:hypothetical protein
VPQIVPDHCSTTAMFHFPLCETTVPPINAVPLVVPLLHQSKHDTRCHGHRMKMSRSTNVNTNTVPTQLFPTVRFKFWSISTIYAYLKAESHRMNVMRAFRSRVSRIPRMLPVLWTAMRMLCTKHFNTNNHQVHLLLPAALCIA